MASSKHWRGKKLVELTQNGNEHSDCVENKSVAMPPVLTKNVVIDKVALWMDKHFDSNFQEQDTMEEPNNIDDVTKENTVNKSTYINIIKQGEKNNLIEATEQHDVQIKTVKRKCNALVEYSLSDFSADDTDMDPTFEIGEITDESVAEMSVCKEQPKSRWRSRNVKAWKCNILKEKRANCEVYENKTKICPAKSPKPINCTQCRYDCSANFNENERSEICKIYWSLNDFKRQKDFIINHIEASPRRPKSKMQKKKKVSRKYFLANDKKKFRVCASFFEKTLCISNGPINTALKGKINLGCYNGVDNRGRKSPGNKTNDVSIGIVKEHIESFPYTEAHYVRSSSKKLYLDSNLSILKMYSLYVDFCKIKNAQPVSEPTYRRVFCSQYNLSFFKPKKDQCAFCSKYKNADEQLKKDLETEYCLHIIIKNESQADKECDKERSKEDKTFCSISFDLQKVLQLPSSAESPFHYSRKLCVYNLTIYEGDGSNAYCNVWNELNGKRDSNEIGSILLNYIRRLPEEVTHLSLFSDTCGGQNRNQQVAAVLLFSVRTTHVVEVEQKFLESGHSHMDCDSMHASIEHARKNKSLYLMKDWIDVFQMARSKRGRNTKDPYKIEELKYNDFYDLHELSNNIIKNKNLDEHGNKVNWLKIKCFKFEKSQPNIFQYKYDYSTSYKKINVLPRTRRNTNPSQRNEDELKHAYNH